MCGRSRCALAPEEVIARARTNNWENQEQYTPTNNVAPGARTPVVFLTKTGERKIHTMRWGLVPSFTKPTEKPDFWRMFNARSESIEEKPSFRRLVPTRRCLVLLNGFFEWKKEGNIKQPYYIYLVNEKTGEEEPMVMAGLWDTWHRESSEDAGDDDDEVMHTYTILTTDSSPELKWLHDRMPVILKDEAAQEQWLDTTNKSNLSKLHSILGPYPGKNLKWHPVTREMSNLAFQGPEAYREIKKPSIKSFFEPKKKPKEAAAAAVKPSRHPDGAEAPSPSSTAADAQAKTPDSMHKRKLPESPKPPPPSSGGGGSHKKKKQRPADQPDIAAFFSAK